MTDYICDGIRLADGWDLTEGQLTLPGGKFTYVTKDDFPQYYKDAIAAQLVRQVDALGGEVWFRNREQVFVFKDGEQARGTDPDRTMNTIRVIVDSGMLAKENTDRTFMEGL